MMRITVLLSLSVLILFSACKKTKDTNAEDQKAGVNSQVITELEVSKLKYTEYALDAKAETIIQDWAEYTQIAEVIANIKLGDLTFFNDNEKAIEVLLQELKQNIPASIESPSIMARIQVLETKILKLESLTHLSTTSKEELLLTIKEFFVSFSTLSYQINKKVEFDNRSIEKP